MKVTVFFPWGTDCVRNKSNGAGLRVRLMLEHLSAQGFDVECVSLSWHESHHSNGKITYSDKRLFNLISYCLYGFTVKLGAYTKWVFPQAIMLYLLPRLSKQFRDVCTNALNGTDFIFLEYPFWAIPIQKLAVAGGKPFLLTNHDQAWKSWTDFGPFRRPSGEILKRLEISSMKAADHCFVVSNGDRDAFETLGVEPTVVPNSVDCDYETLAAGQLSALRDKWKLPRDAKSALFVGGGWFPNRVAVDNICKHIAPNLPEINFYVIGRCSDGFLGRKPANVAFIERADNNDLEYFYASADLVLIPILQGTGSSLKSIEALSRGKAVFSTSVGVRDLGVVSGVHAIIEDDLAKYPELVRSFLADDGLRCSLQEQARLFALRFDYRKCYQPYLDILHAYAGHTQA